MRPFEPRFRQANYKTSYVVGLSRKSLEQALARARRRVNEVALDTCLFRVKQAGQPPAPNYQAGVIGFERLLAVGAIYYRVLMRVDFLAPVRRSPRTHSRGRNVS